MSDTKLATTATALPTLEELRELQKAENLTNRANFEQLTLLMDWSPSMEDRFKNGSGSKWDSAKKAIQMLWEKTSWDICDTKLFLFETGTHKKDFSPEHPPILPEKPSGGGGTSFINALRAGIDEDASRMILISDGESAFPDTEVTICKEKQIVVDTIYIAGMDDIYNGPKILQQISEATGGIFTTVENAEQLMESLMELETSERLLLGHDPDSNGAIEL